MSNDAIEIAFPIGRLLQGDVAKSQTKDANGGPLIYTRGDKIGQPKPSFYFAVGIKKSGETHWNQTSWGQQIYTKAQQDWPKGQFNQPKFAWKVIDGDSTELNNNQKRWCDHVGFPGHWVVKFQRPFAPNLYTKVGSLNAKLLTDPNAIKLGNYVQVIALVKGNGENAMPGMYINHSDVCLMGYHPDGEIVPIPETDVSAFDDATGVPADMISTPVAQTPPPVAQTPPPVVQIPSSFIVPPPVGTAPIPPAPDFLVPAPPAQKRMTAAANGIPYESYKAQKWTDEMLIAHGLMEG